MTDRGSLDWESLNRQAIVDKVDDRFPLRNYHSVLGEYPLLPGGQKELKRLLDGRQFAL